MIDRIDFEVGSDGQVTVTKLRRNSPVGTEVKPAGFALAAALDDVEGISAAATFDGYLTITSDSSELEFAFKDDTSGVLAALGLNTFFTGSNAMSLGVNSELSDDPGKFAASRDGIGVDTDNAIDLADFLSRSLDSRNGATLMVLHDSLMGETIQGSTVTRSIAEGTRVFEQTLRGRKLSVSGVSLDEEACTACGVCLRIGCPAITLDGETEKPEINFTFCTGCGLCTTVCPCGALSL